jgi:hypothetical protein
MMLLMTTTTTVSMTSEEEVGEKTGGVALAFQTEGVRNQVHTLDYLMSNLAFI